MTRQELQEKIKNGLNSLNTLSLLLKTWLLWLLIQGIIQAFWFNQWFIGLFYEAQLYGFGQLAKELQIAKFNERLLFWLKVSLVFFYGKTLLCIYGNSAALLAGTYSPSKLICNLITLSFEAIYLIKLKQTQKEVETSESQQILIDENTGEIIEEMV